MSVFYFDDKGKAMLQAFLFFANLANPQSHETTLYHSTQAIISSRQNAMVSSRDGVFPPRMACTLLSTAFWHILCAISLAFSRSALTLTQARHRNHLDWEVSRCENMSAISSDPKPSLTR